MIEAGTYFLAPDADYGVPPLRISFVVPDDTWRSWGPGIATSWGGFGFVNVGNVYADACHADLGPLNPAIGPGVDDLIVAFDDLRRYEATAPTDVTLSGFRGKHRDFVSNGNVTNCDGGEYVTFIPVQTQKSDSLWETPGGHVGYYGPLGDVWILDVEPIRLVIFASVSSEHRADLQEVLDTITIER